MVLPFKVLILPVTIYKDKDATITEPENLYKCIFHYYYYYGRVSPSFKLGKLLFCSNMISNNHEKSEKDMGTTL